MENIKRGVESGNITPDSSLIRFSDEALEEQKHCIRIADEKVALAVQAYDIVGDSELYYMIIQLIKVLNDLPACLFHAV